MPGRTLLQSIVSSVALVASSGAYAADPAAPASSSGEPTSSAEKLGGRLEEVVVTAQRRAESLQRVPISVSAFNTEALTASGVRDTQDLATVVPGLTFTKGLTAGLPFLRGVGHNYANLGDESPVAVYIDDVYIPNTASNLFSFPNIKQIEVLKGPQGTLFGRNATGGVIHVITREPEPTPTAEASLGYANHEKVDANFYGSTPIGKNAGVNFAALYAEQFDGWGTNQLTGNDAYLGSEFGGTSKLIWTPSDRDKLTVRAFYSRQRSDYGVASGIAPGALGTDGTPHLGQFDPRKPDNWQRTTAFNASVDWRHDFGWATLVNITAYHRTEADVLFNNNGIEGNLLPGQSTLEAITGGDTDTFTEELRLESSTSSGFEWIAGLYYLNDVTDGYLGTYGTCVGTVCNGGTPTLTNGRQQTRSYSVFGQTTIDLFANTRLTTGLRFTQDDKDLSGTSRPLPGRPNSPAPNAFLRTAGSPQPGFPNGIPTSFTDKELTWRVAIDQQLTEDILAYVSYNRGFKSGNYNVTSFSNPPTDPEIIDAYEVGLKTELFDRTVRLNTAVFYYDYSDIQLRTSGPPAPPGTIILYNAAQARVTGIDLDVQMAVTHSLAVTGGVEYLNAEYTDFPNGTCSTPRIPGGTVAGGSATVPCDLSGYDMIRSPELTGNVGFTHDMASVIGTFQLAASDRYSSSFTWDPDGRLRQEPYHDLRASLSWTSADERLSGSLWIKNALDEVIYSSLSAGAADLALSGAPRTYGVTLGTKF